jgi:2-methylcitrate dehydratase PrpD
MTSQCRDAQFQDAQGNDAPADPPIDRRVFLGAAGALTLAAPSALAQDAKPEARPEPPLQSAHLADTIADFVAGFDAAALPPLAVARTRLAFVDTLAVMLAGSREEGSAIVCEMVQQEEAAPKASVVGQRFRTSPQLAALANGVAAHVMDYDFSSILGQPTSPVIPALLPLAETTGATPAEVAAAFAVGFEVCLRLGRAAPEQAAVAGWHAVSSIGTIGAAMACARLLKVPRERIPAVLGIAASLSGGLTANFGTMTKPLHSGASARSAVMAATLGSRGFTASAVALEHPKAGYFQAFDRGMKVSYEPFADLGRRYDLAERGFKQKRYPCGGLTHTAIDATLDLREEINGAGIAAVKVGFSRFVASLIGTHWPATIESAKFSMAYIAAWTALHGPPLLTAFTEEAIHDEAVKALAGKVSVVVDPEFADLLDESPARVTVTLADGRTVERMRRTAVGTPQTPFTREQVAEKFFSCAERVVNRAAAEKIFAFTGTIEQQGSFAEFWELVRA